jgi:hypothetical protein
MGRVGLGAPAREEGPNKVQKSTKAMRGVWPEFMRDLFWSDLNHGDFNRCRTRGKVPCGIPRKGLDL